MNWYLNSAEKQYRSAPASSIFFVGNGTNLIWLDPDHDTVVVVRWLRNVDGFIAKVLGAYASTN
jgi:hypothetical protein